MGNIILLKFAKSKVFIVACLLLAAPLVGVGLAVVPDKVASLGVFSMATPEKAAEMAFADCTVGKLKPGTTQENCYADEMAKVAQAKGGDFAFQTLYALQKLDDNTVGCHFIAHGIGYGIYKRDPGHWRDSVNSVDSSCSYGAIHGIIEQYVLTSLPGGKLDPKLLPTICGDSPRADCNHILGHLTLVFTKGDVSTALADCNVFKDEGQRFQCKTGVFMEEQTAVNLIAHGMADKSWNNWAARVPELTQTCRDQKVNEEIEACWQEVTHAALVKFDNDAGQLFDYCDSAQLKSAAAKCEEHGLGIISAADRRSFKDLGAICVLPQIQRDSFTWQCVSTLLSSVLVTSHDRVAEAAGYCGTLVGDTRGNCFGLVGSLARGISSEAGKVCDSMSGSDKEECQKGPAQAMQVTSD